MGRQIDYAALARQHGGVLLVEGAAASGRASEPDYAALAEQFGGTSVTGLESMPLAVSHRRPGEVPPQTVGRFAREATQSINPLTILEGISQSVLDPVGTVGGVISAHDRARQQAQEAFRRGDYVAGVRHSLEYALPYVTGVGGAALGLPGGPAGVVAGAAGGYALGTGVASRLDEGASRLAEGDIAGGLGASVDAASMTALGARGAVPAQRAISQPGRTLSGTARRVIERVTPKNLSAAEAAAVAFGRERGIPVDVGTATGRQFLKNAQKASGPYGPAEAFRASQAEQLGRVGRDLAADAGPRPMPALAAGEGVRQALETKVGSLHTLANDAYTRLRSAEMAAPEELVAARPRKPVAAHVTPDQSYILKWLARDLEEFQYQPSSRMRGARALDEFQQRGYGDVDTTYAPRVAGTPVQEMFHAAGIKGSRAEIATKIEKYLTGQQKDPRFAKLADAVNEAWDGQHFDFDLVSDDTLVALGLRRRDLKSPIGLPDFAEPGAARFFPEEAIPAAPGGARGGDTPMRAAFDMRPHKEALRPLLEELQREREITGSLLGQKGKAAVALESLINGPDFAPVSSVDAALGSLKGLARGAASPALRNRGQGVAARVVGELESGLQARVKELGGDMAQALGEGRAATKAKYRVADVLKQLPTEPARVFKQLTARDDSGIRKLRAVAAEVPDEIPNIARATLEGLLESASKGGTPFENAQLAWANWQRLGAETRARLFPGEGQIKAINNFFLLAKKISENPNPSGTANVAASLNPMKALPAWAVAKILYAPDGPARLSKAQILLKSPSRSARALALGELAHSARSAGVAVGSIPALAGGAETETPWQRRTR